MRTWRVIAAAAMVCASASAQSTEPATTGTAGTIPATQPAHDAAFFDALMAHMQLVSQAQRDLDMVTVAEREKLKDLTASATDPDVKAALTARLQVLDEESALNPAPLSLEVKEASLGEVGAAMQKALGVPVEGWPAKGQGNNAPTFTLKCEGKGFWEIFTQLSDQHGLTVQAYNGLRIQAGKPGLHRFFPAGSGCAAFPMTIRRSVAIDPQLPQGRRVEAARLSFHYALATDPRMKVVKFSQAVLEMVRDEAGNDLLDGRSAESTYMQEAQQGQCLFEHTATLKAPAGTGKKVALARGQWSFLVVLGEDVVEVDPLEVLNKPITIGESVVTISNWKVHGQSIDFQIQSPGYEGGAGIGVAFVDAKGKQVWQTRMQGGVGGGAGGQFVEPVKVRFTTARKSKQITMPFEMKDLPLP